MENKKRNIRTYKVADSSYFGAQEICNKGELPLANIIETLVEEIHSKSAISTKIVNQLIRLRKKNK